MTPYTHTHNAGIDSYLFENGFKLILAHYPGAPKARVELVVRVGSKHEGYGETGMAHLLEHMLYKSNPLCTDMKATLTQMSSEWNGSTSTDRTNYHEVVAPERVIDAIELERNRLLHATFTQDDLRSEMTVVRNEMDQYASDTNSVMLNTFMRSAFDWHGYGRSTIGSPSDVEDAPFAALRLFYAKHYRVSNAFLFVAGNFNAQQVLDHVAKQFGALPGQGDESIATANWTVEPAHTGGTCREVFMPMNKVHAWIGWRMPPMFTSESVALQLAMQTLGSHERGALRRQLVIDEKKFVDIQAMPYDLLDGGVYLFTGHGKPTDNASVLAETMAQQVYTHLAVGIDAQDLENTRQDELAQYHDILGNWENLSYILVDAELQGDWQWMFARKAMVESVTHEDMLAAARKWIVPHAQTTVLLHNGTPNAPGLFKVPPPVVFPQYPSIVMASDPVAASYEELGTKETVWYPDSHLRLSLSQRRTQAGYVYVEYESIVGSDSTRTEHFDVAQCARDLRAFGGAGKAQKEFSAWLNVNKAEVQFRTMGFSLRVPPENALDVLRQVLDIFHAPLFTQDEFNAFKDNKLNKLTQAMAKLEPVLGTRLAQKWSNYPVGHWGQTLSLEDTYASVSGVSYVRAQDSLAWMSRRGMARLTLVGAVDPAALETLAHSYVQRYPFDNKNTHAALVPPEYSAILQAGPPMVIEFGNSPNATVGSVAPLRMNTFHPDAPALVNAVQVFGRGAASRLWMRIREQGGMAYQVGAELSLNAVGQRSALHMFSSCSSEQADEVYRAMVQEWNRFVQDGVTQEEMDAAKEQRGLHHQSVIQNDEGYVEVYHRAPLTQQDYAWKEAFQKAERDVVVVDVNGAIARHFAHLPIQWALARRLSEGSGA